MKDRDLRAYARQTNVRIAIGALLLLFVVGDGLIYIIFGPAAAVTGLLCLGAAMLPVALILLVLWGIDWMVRRANRE
jgi:hypothetical protein